MIEIIKDINLINDVGKYDVILVGTNCYQAMKNGFQGDVALYFPYVLKKNCDTRYGDIAKLGSVIECSEDNAPTFALLFISKGYNFRPDKESDYLSYESIEKCMKLVNVLYKGKRIATTKIGCDRNDGNGDWDKVLKIIEGNITDCNLFIYDFYQEENEEKWLKSFKKNIELKKKNREEYYKAIKEIKNKNKYLKELRKKYFEE